MRPVKIPNIHRTSPKPPERESKRAKEVHGPL
jgi:hypothetical protein